MRVYSVISDYSKEAIEILKRNSIEVNVNDTNKEYSTDEIVKLLQDYDCLIIGVRTKISKDILDYVKEPKVIATLSIGLDHIDSEVINSDVVKVINVKESIAHSVAEHIFSLILALSKRVYVGNDLVINGDGDRKYIRDKPEDIYGKTLGLIGAGNITKEVIKIASVFDMKMICYTKHPDKHSDLLDYVVEFKSLDDVLSESDIVNVSIPLTEETTKIISKEKLNLMKENAIFINTSRADVVDMRGLFEKVDKNKKFYVGLDIDCDEYEFMFSFFKTNVIVTPHIAGLTKQAIDKMDLEIAKKIIEIKNSQ